MRGRYVTVPTHASLRAPGGARRGSRRAFEVGAVGGFNEDLYRLYTADVSLTFDVNLRTEGRRNTCNLALELRERELVPAA